MSRKEHQEAIKKELAALEDRGLLQAEEIVKFARNSKTALHSEFEWDDSKAAQRYRIWQARQIIISVEVVINGDRRPTRAYVSLPSDRRGEGGGYRSTVSVLNSADLRNEMLRQALVEFQFWREKYETLTELAAIFIEAEKVNRKTLSKKSRSRRRKLAKV